MVWWTGHKEAAGMGRGSIREDKMDGCRDQSWQCVRKAALRCCIDHPSHSWAGKKQVSLLYQLLYCLYSLTHMYAHTHNHTQNYSKQTFGSPAWAETNPWRSKWRSKWEKNNEMHTMLQVLPWISIIQQASQAGLPRVNHGAVGNRCHD